MQQCHCSEAVDMMFRDIRDNSSSFGDTTLVFGGDFRQILHVVPKGSMAQIMEAYLHKFLV